MWLLLAVPLSLLSSHFHWEDSYTFFFAFCSLIPLAGSLGDFTEDLALRSNESIGALLNATFGNATEMIVSVFALRAGMYDVIKNSLVGSVLGNMLLVLGSAQLIAGLRTRNIHGAMSFNASAARMYCNLLMLACIGVAIPSIMVPLNEHRMSSERPLHVSRELSILMVIAYVLYMFFQLYTHKEMFSCDDCNHAEGQEEEEAEEPHYTAGYAVMGLLVATLLISVESDFLVDTLDVAAKEWGLSKSFVSVILLPIVGNAAEHSTAIWMAYKGKMDIAIGVAIGSSLQIALFAVPCCVLISWGMGKELDLQFDPMLTLIMIASVLITGQCVRTGHANWLKGAMLLLTYAMLSVTLLNLA